MGAGKSAVGRHLARLLHLDFVDSDDEIEARTGVDIAFIFEKEGEEGFRKREVKVIDEPLNVAVNGPCSAAAIERKYCGNSQRPATRCITKSQTWW